MTDSRTVVGLALWLRATPHKGAVRSSCGPACRATRAARTLSVGTRRACLSSGAALAPTTARYRRSSASGMSTTGAGRSAAPMTQRRESASGLCPRAGSALGPKALRVGRGL